MLVTKYIKNLGNVVRCETLEMLTPISRSHFLTALGHNLRIVS